MTPQQQAAYERAVEPPKLDFVDGTAEGLVLEHGLWIDTETGEVVREDDPATGSFTKDEAEKVLSRLQWHDARRFAAMVKIERLRATIQAKVDAALAELDLDPDMIALNAQLGQQESIFARADKSVAWYTQSYEEPLKRLAQEILGDGKTRSVHFDHGTVSLTRQGALLKVEDPEVAANALESMKWVAYITKSVKLADLKKDKDAYSLLLGSPPEGFSVKPADDKVKIDLGVGK